LFKKKRKREQQSPPSEDADAAEPIGREAAERSIDVLAQILRTFGELSFDTAESEHAAVQESFETWARHLLLGVPPPGGATLAEGV